ncbi:MAG: hypothetical protein KGZ65_04355 [Sphingomonadales bacterium]|nr:hypothetical protein [Sphingomonadaceae bacterium]MBS3930446.1 hypothetical protein [Sphingomonadales bacterium]
MANQVLTTSLTPSLDWADVSGALEYWVQVATDPRFRTITQQKTGLATSTHTIASSLTDAKKYYWRFRTRTTAAYTTDQAQTTQGAVGVALRDAAARTGLAQSFKPTYSLPIARIALSLKKTLAPTGNIWVEIWTDSPGAPSAQLLADSAVVNIATLTTSFASYNFDFTFPIPVVAGTTYYVVLQADNAIDAANYATWETSGSNNYSRGGPFQHDGSVAWTAPNTFDHVFNTQYQGGWGTWSPTWSFWVDSTAEAAFTPSVSNAVGRYSYIDPDETTDTYTFACNPKTKADPVQMQKAFERNLSGDLLSEFIATRALIKLDFNETYIALEQKTEIERFANKRKDVYLVVLSYNRQDVVENIYKVAFTKGPTFEPLAHGREDLFVGDVEHEESANT